MATYIALPDLKAFQTEKFRKGKRKMEGSGGQGEGGKESSYFVGLTLPVDF